MRHNTGKQVLKDMERGKEGVEKVKAHIEKKYGIKSRTTDEGESKREHIDLKILKKEEQDVDEKVYLNFVKKYGYKLEVKYDQTANRTKNIYLEIWSNVRTDPHNPGTISQCRAHSVWYVLDDKFLVFDRAALLSCLITHFYFDTEQAKNWREKTSKPFWQKLIKEHLSKFNSFVDRFGEVNGEIKTSFMPAGVNADVRGILISVSEIERLKEKIGLIDTIHYNENL